MAVTVSPTDVLKRLMEEIPEQTEEWYRKAFVRIVDDNSDLQETIFREVYEEIGMEGIKMLMKPPSQRH
jgi:hypothetical protein